MSGSALDMIRVDQLPATTADPVGSADNSAGHSQAL